MGCGTLEVNFQREIFGGGVSSLTFVAFGDTWSQSRSVRVKYEEEKQS